MKTASRKIRVAITALCTVFALCSVALAVGAVDTGRNCSLEVKVGGTIPDEQKPNVALTANLYKVASVSDTYTYTAVSGFDPALSGFVGFTPEQINAAATAAKAVATAEGSSVAAAKTVRFQGDETGSLTGVECGLYLLLTTAVDSTDTNIYTSAPVLLSLPSMNNDGSDAYDISGVELKFESAPATTSIKIKKDLTTYSERQGPATFIFKVEAVKGEATVYSNVFSMVFTAAGSKEITVENLPVGSRVTVSEVYGGGSYAVNGSDTVVMENLTKPAEGAAPATAAFVNDYNKKTPTSHSVTNQYTYTGGAWAVNQVRDAE